MVNLGQIMYKYVKEREQKCRVSLSLHMEHGENASLFAWEQPVEEERNMMCGAHIREDKPVQGNVRLLASLPKRFESRSTE